MITAMIPARLGSQRLKQKNLRTIHGIPIIAHAARKCVEAKVFDRVVVNSESEAFKSIAEANGAEFYQRPDSLGDNRATSEQYITDYLKSNPCDYLVQVHSIAPLITVEQIRLFSEFFINSNLDVLLSVTREQIECLYEGQPINFRLSEKTNSQELTPIERVTWSITGWKGATFLEAVEKGECATYYGKVGTFAIDREAGHIIKTEDDLMIAQALWEARKERLAAK